MKYDITYSCGHTGIVELTGKGTEREKRIHFLTEYGLCPDCYKNKKQEEKKAEPFQIEVRLQPFKNKPFQLVFTSGDTKAYKEQIKSLGFEWAEVDINTYLSVVDSAFFTTYAWIKNVDEKDIQSEFEKVKEVIPNVLEKIHKGFYNRDYVLYKKFSELKKDVVRPEKPSCYPNGYWNGTFYKAAEGKQRIYVNKNEVIIDQKDADSIKEYQKEMKKYKKLIQKLKESVLNED